MKKAIARLQVESLIAIERGEYAKTFLLFAYLFFMTSATIVGRTAADTLFLSRFDVKKLSYMYLAISITLSLFGIFYHAIVDRFRKDRLNYTVTGILILLVIASRFLLESGEAVAYPVVYVAFEAFNFLLILQFWTFTNDILDTRQAKRLIGFIGSAGLLGGMVTGFSIKAIVHQIGMLNLVYVYAGLMATTIVTIRLIAIRENDALAKTHETPAKPGRRRREPQSIRGIFHLKLIAITVAIITMVLIFVDYQFKNILAQQYQNEALAAFLGQFYGFTGVIAIAFQFFFSSRILTRLGILPSLLMLPVFLLISAVGLIFSPILPAEWVIGSMTLSILPSLGAVVLAKGSDKIISDTIYSSASQLMYVPIAASVRGRAKVFVDGIIKPLSKGFAALLLIGSMIYFPVEIEHISYLVVVLLIVCIAAMFMVKREYVKSLFSTLKTSQLDFRNMNVNLSDSSAIEILVDGLKSNDERQVLYCLETLKNIEGFYLLPHLLELLNHSKARVQIETLRILEVLTPRDAKQDVIRMLESVVPAVKVQAILTLSAYQDEDNMKRILGYLLDEKAEIRGAAVSGLMEYYGIDGIFYSVDIFKQMMDSPHVYDRIEVPRILGRIGLKNFHKPLVKLLDDASKDVQLSAIEASKRVQVPTLIPLLIKKLRQKETRWKAVEALSAYDRADIVPTLKIYLEYSDRYREVSIYIPRVFELIATAECGEILLASYKAAHPYLRSKILDSAYKIQLRSNEWSPPSETIEQLVQVEADEYRYLLRATRVLRGQEGVAILIEAITTIRQQILERLFKLIGFLQDHKTTMTVYNNLSAEDKRVKANAVEVMDNLLTGKLREIVLEVITKIDDEKIEKADLKSFFDLLMALFDRDYDWVKMVIEFVAGSPRIAAMDDNRAYMLKKHCQEAKVSYDRNELLATIQKVAVLKKVSFFASLSGEYLSNIAMSMHAVKYDKGENVFEEGHVGDSFYIIVKGKVLVHKGPTKIVELETGQGFGEMAILDNEKRSASVTALEDTILFRLDSDNFYDIIAERIEIAKGVIRMLSQRLRAQLAKLGPPKNKGTADEEEIAASMEVPVSTESGLDSGSLLRRILVLKDIDLFASLNDEDMVLLANMVEEVTYKKGEDVFREGDVGEAMYSIKEGAVLVHRGNTELAVLKNKEYFGEMAVLDNEPRSASVTALRDCVLFKLSSDDFYSLLFDKVEITRSIFAVLVRRLRETSGR